MANIITLAIEDLSKLNKAHSKLTNRKKLGNSERDALLSLLAGLPNVTTLIEHQYKLDENLKVEMYGMEKSWSYIEKWIDLFNSLPEETAFTGIHAMAIDAQSDEEHWRKNIIIEVSFIPTLGHSKRKNNQSIYLELKIDGTAVFKFILIKDAELFKTLYHFNGSWKEAYLLVVKTLKQGWPQTAFPKGFEHFLNK